MEDLRVPFGLRDCATDSEASWDRESDLDSVFPSDSDADSFIGELGSDVCDAEFFAGTNGDSVEKDGAKPNNDNHSGLENGLLNNVVDGDRLPQSAKGDPKSGDGKYRRYSSEQSWKQEHIAAYQGPEEGSVFDQFSSRKKESWSEIDERARLDDEAYQGEARPKAIKAAHAGRNERPRKRGGGRGRRKKQQAQKRNESTPGHPREGYEGGSRSQNWTRRSGKGGRPRGNRNKDDKKIPARRPGRCDPPLINAVVRPFTLPAGPITILRRPPATAPVPEDTNGLANNCNGSGPSLTYGISPKLNGLHASQEHSSVHESPPPSLPNASQDSGDLIGVGPTTGVGAGGSHVIHVTTRYGPGIVVENPKAEIKEFGGEGTDSENEERLKAARDAAELAMAGLSMGTEDEIPKPRKEHGRKISAETYDRGYIGSVDMGPPPEPKPKYPKRRSRGSRARNRSKNGEKNGSMNQKFQPKFLLTRPSQAPCEGRSEFHHATDNIYREVGE
ncbi:hypothetical protein BSKO_01740 [Bryopsis sp. KO-2023]|nr:hypothetical protein BSKO_01740 [Bryopsis sp. KO-2023]